MIEAMARRGGQQRRKGQGRKNGGGRQLTVGCTRQPTKESTKDSSQHASRMKTGMQDVPRGASSPTLAILGKIQGVCRLMV